jgi:hypothetical protein
VAREAQSELRRVLGSEAQYERSLKGLPDDQIKLLMQAQRRSFLDSMGRYYEAFLSVGRDDDAEKVRSGTLGFDDSWYTGLAMARASVRAERVDASHVEAARLAHEATGSVDAAVAATYIDTLMATGQPEKARKVGERVLASANLKGDPAVVKRALAGG